MASLLYMYVAGHPIVNDPLYNSPSWGPLRGKGGHCDVSHEEVDRLTAVVVVDCFYRALFSTLDQTHCSLVACGSE